MNNIEQIWRFHEFRRLWFIGLASGSARWIEVLCFSVFAWKITKDATVAGWLMTSRMSGVMLAGTLFTVFGGRHSGQLVMITIYGLCALACSIGILVTIAHYDSPSTPFINLDIIVFGVISFLSGMLWSIDFSFRRRMLGDSLPPKLVGAGVSFDVMSSHATRLVAMLAGGALLGLGNITLLLVLLTLLYVCSCWMLRHAKDRNIRSKTGAAKTFNKVIKQARSSLPITVVLALTPIFNIFVLPYLALIALVLLEKFRIGEALAGTLSAIEGAGAVAGGVIIALVQPIKPVRIFIYALIGLLASLMMISSLPHVGPVMVALFLGGILSSIYSAMQSTIIYNHSRVTLRSPTLSLMTLFIGSGVIGTLNVSWLAKTNDVANVIRIMSFEGIVLLSVVLLAIKIHNKNTNSK